MSTAAVIQTAFLGDVVLTTPLIETLAWKFGPVDVVTTPENAPLIETLPTVNGVVQFDKRGAHRGLHGVLQISGILRRRKLDYAFLPHQSVRSAMVARCAGIANRIGFAGGPASWCYTDRRVLQTFMGHETERLHALANEDCPTPRPRIEVTETDRLRANAALRASGVMDNYLVLAPGSRRPTKRWPYFKGLAESLTCENDVELVGGPDDAMIGDGVVSGRVRLANLAGALSIRETAAVMENARLVICNDSVALHLAGAVQTPTVAIFGPTDPAMGFGPRGATDVVIAKRNLPCRPCSMHGGNRCPLRHHRCMVDLAVDTVAEIIQNAVRAEAKR